MVATESFLQNFDCFEVNRVGLSVLPLRVKSRNEPEGEGKNADQEPCQYRAGSILHNARDAVDRHSGVVLTGTRVSYSQARRRRNSRQNSHSRFLVNCRDLPGNAGGYLFLQQDRPVGDADGHVRMVGAESLLQHFDSSQEEPVRLLVVTLWIKNSHAQQRWSSRNQGTIPAEIFALKRCTTPVHLSRSTVDVELHVITFA